MPLRVRRIVLSALLAMAGNLPAAAQDAALPKEVQIGPRDDQDETVLTTMDAVVAAITAHWGPPTFHGWWHEDDFPGWEYHDVVAYWRRKGRFAFVACTVDSDLPELFLGVSDGSPL